MVSMAKKDKTLGEKITGMFKKAPVEKKIEVSEKDKATAKGEPFVKVLDINYDKSNPGDGYFELEWNNIFVKKLLDAGYSGANENEIVDSWFTGLCRQISEDPGFKETT